MSPVTGPPASNPSTPRRTAVGVGQSAMDRAHSPSVSCSDCGSRAPCHVPRRASVSHEKPDVELRQASRATPSALDDGRRTTHRWRHRKEQDAAAGGAQVAQMTDRSVGERDGYRWRSRAGCSRARHRPRAAAADVGGANRCLAPSGQTMSRAVTAATAIARPSPTRRPPIAGQLRPRAGPSRSPRRCRPRRPSTSCSARRSAA